MFRERGKEGKREGEKYQSPATFQSTGQRSIHKRIEPGQEGVCKLQSKVRESFL